MSPNYLIKETDRKNASQKSVHFHRHTHSLILGWLSAQTVGLWSIFKLYRQVFKPSIDAASFTSLTYMDPESKLSVMHNGEMYNQLQVGYTIVEMANRVESLLKSIGLTQNFAPIVYVVGHGSSSVNNPHASAYDCGACSGRPGSVNARVISQMANNAEVRKLLKDRGIEIPDSTQFMGALHDTTRDEVLFYDKHELSAQNQSDHAFYEVQFKEALTQNAVERADKFELIDSKKTKEKIHNLVRSRAVSLFEPRPELNHATNALCIVGRRHLTRSAFLDRRAFLNSYDYSIDPQGDFLYGILKAAAPVCGGINLEYYFSRVDNSNFGAGSKLPHNVMGLIGVANGVDGDLRTGLPVQMIEIHDPVRLLFVVEQFPDRLLSVIQRDDATYNWFREQWVHLVCVHPETQEYFQFNQGAFVPVMYR